MKARVTLKIGLQIFICFSKMSYTFFHGSPRVRSGPPEELKVTFIWRLKRHRVLYRDCVLAVLSAHTDSSKQKAKQNPLGTTLSGFICFI